MGPLSVALCLTRALTLHAVSICELGLAVMDRYNTLPKNVALCKPQRLPL